MFITEFLQISQLQNISKKKHTILINLYQIMQISNQQNQIQSIINTLLQSSIQVSKLIRNTIVLTLQTKNKFGDTQLHLDVQSDHLIQKHLKQNQLIAGFLSQQRPHYNQISNKQSSQYIITYDPLDGSSIIDTNFSIGSIFGIWKKNSTKLIGEKVGDSLVNALIIIYGPRTTAIKFNDLKGTIEQLTLVDDKWILSEPELKIKPTAKIFAPGNLRAVNQNKNYSNQVNKWIARGLTLRYTGGLVPDVNQIFLKGNGILANISSVSHKAKLRVLYEVTPIAFLIEKAGGRSVVNGHSSALNHVIKGYDQRVECIFGSSKEVEEIEYLLK